jgi:acyl carrier protein
MNIKNEIKQILKINFDFEDDDDSLIYNNLDSVKYYKLLLLLEEKFKINLEKMDISSVNKIYKIIINYENFKIYK